MPWIIAWLNALAALSFLVLGFKAYWDHSGWTAFIILAATLALGWMAAWMARQLAAKAKRGSHETSAHGTATTLPQTDSKRPR
jgi:hypothetical protein